MVAKPRSPKYRLPLALIATTAVLGAILQSVWEGQERKVFRAPETPPRTDAEGWSGVRIEPRSFPPGSHWEQGERLYGWNCMPCHGADGKGDGPMAARLGLRPRDFSRGMFQLKSSVPDEMPFEEDLFRSISTGFPQGAMPAFADFSAEERWALVDHVRSLAPRHFDALPAKRRIPVPDADGDSSRGERLFVRDVQCARCHGDRGRGDGPAAPALVDADDRPASMPDFAQGELSFKAGTRSEDVYRVVTTGLAGTAMPSFQSLPEKDRRDLAKFVTTLYQAVPPGERLFLTRGCTHCHTVGKGKRVGPDLAGISGRRDRSWLRRWLADPPAMLAADPQAREMVREYPVPMPNLNLTESELAPLLEYLLALPVEGKRQGN